MRDLPADAQALRLVSRRSVPAQHRPESADGRCLGVAGGAPELRVTLALAGLYWLERGLRATAAA